MSDNISKPKSGTLIRILSAMVGVVIFFVILFMGELAFKVAVLIITLLLLNEIYSAFKFNAILQITGYLSSAAIIAFRIVGGPTEQFFAFLVFYIIAICIIAVIAHKKIKFEDICYLMFTSFYVVFLALYIARTRAIAEYGMYYVLLVFICAWISDTFAYFSGKFFGKHKLIPQISPKKTVEGAIGGVIGTAVVGCGIFGLVMQFGIGYTVNYLPLFILGLIGGVFAEFGDLVASLMKRHCNVKDFGSIMPGHGGMLDRFDSVLLVAPFVFYYLHFFNILSH